MNRSFIVNGVIVLPDALQSGAALVIENGKIIDTHYAGDIPDGAKVIDADGGYILPGFVDIHLHGGGGYDFMDGTEEAFLKIAETHFRHGTTSMAPTTVSCGDDELCKFFSVYRAAAGKNKTAEFLGVHLEGPYIADSMRGAQRKEYLQYPDLKQVDKILELAGDIIIQWSAAPELSGMKEAAQRIWRRNIRLAVAHSDAICEEILQAFHWGFTHITHLYSNTPSIRKIRQNVCAGVVEAAYLLDEMTVELIGDGKHVPKEGIRLVHKLKGVNRLALITDAMRAAGTDAAESYLGEISPENRVIIEDGVAKLPDRSYFAGSIATGDALFRNAVFNCNLPIIDVSKMMSLTPAAIIGVENRKGSIEAQKDADLVIMDKGLHITQVMGKNTVVDDK